MSVKTDKTLPGRPWKYRIKRWRRGLRARASLWAARRFGTQRAQPGALPHTPERILVCRLNKRLGNILFLTPLLASLAATFPRARIDVLLLEPSHADLLRDLPGVDQVWAPPGKPGLHPLAVIGFIWRVRKRRYDLAIDPNIISVSNRIGMCLSGARKRLGFAGPDQWLRLDYSAPPPRDVPHQALHGLALFEQGLTNLSPTLVKDYRVAPDAAARLAAQRHWQAALGDADDTRPVVGFFIQATGAKKLPEAWWQEWLTAMQASENAPRLLQLLPPGQSHALQAGLPSIRIAPLAELAATLAHLQVFIAADCGPMHLAAAAGVPTIGLFRATKPEHYRPLGPGCQSLEGEDLHPAAAAERVLAQIKRRAID